MLAQNFKTAEDLGIADVELTALISVLGMLERGEIAAFDSRSKGNTLFMKTYHGETEECGTTACLCGWAHTISNKVAFPELLSQSQLDATIALERRLPRAAQRLFWINTDFCPEPTIDDAAVALRSYLTTGDANWKNMPNYR